MIFRKAKREDFDDICLLEKECFKTPFTIADLLSSERNTEFIAYVCYKEEILCGYVTVSCNPWEAEILRIAVKKEFRNNGIAKKLLGLIKEDCLNKNKEKILLEVSSKNETAINLYSSFGFKNIAVRKKYYENTEDAIIMELCLRGVFGEN